MKEHGEVKFRVYFNLNGVGSIRAKQVVFLIFSVGLGRGIRVRAKAKGSIWPCVSGPCARGRAGRMVETGDGGGTPPVADAVQLRPSLPLPGGLV